MAEIKASCWKSIFVNIVSAAYSIIIFTKQVYKERCNNQKIFNFITALYITSIFYCTTMTITIIITKYSEKYKKKKAYVLLYVYV
jgi:hypothetical protein